MGTSWSRSEGRGELLPVLSVWYAFSGDCSMDLKTKNLLHQARQAGRAEAERLRPQLEKAVREHPDSLLCQMTLGLVEKRIGNFSRAALILGEALKLATDANHARVAPQSFAAYAEQIRAALRECRDGERTGY